MVKWLVIYCSKQGSKPTTQTEARDLTEQELEEQDFINAILVDNEDVWTKIFKKI
jgi:predicted metalloprotease